jgi:lipoprotein signal peptidase
MPRRRVVLAAACVLALFALNLYISLKLFGCEYTNSMHSIEGNFIAMSRLRMLHPGQVDWWPFWAAGMPIQHTYYPLMPATIAVVGNEAGWSAARSYHVVTALLYCLGPVTLFLMAWVMSRKLVYSFWTGVAYSLVSPAALVFSATRADVGGVWNAWRLHLLAYWGESPHLAALTLVPLALLFVYLSLRDRRRIYYLAAGVLMAAVAVTNSFGTVALALGVVALISTQNQKSFWKDLGLMSATGAVAYVWISPWLPPSVLHALWVNSPTSGGDYRFTSRTLVALVVEALLLVLLWLWARRSSLPAHLRFFLFFAALAGSIPLLGAFANLNVLPQPGRYQPEMEMALCLAGVFALQPVLDRLPHRARLVLAVLLVALAVRQTIVYRRFARNRIQPIDVTQTFEYQTAQWMERRFRNQRVMATGSCSFWLNTFVDTPQLSGAQEPFAPNRQQIVAVFINYSSWGAGQQDGEIASLWLKAFGVHAINVSGPKGREIYKAVANSKKFEGLLPVLWREGDDTIYEVPQRTASLAHVIPADAMITRTPRHGVDVELIRPFVAALEDASLPPADIRWDNFSSGHIEATLRPGQVVSVQITYHPGWHAKVGGVTQPVVRDGLGLMVVKPNCTGPCTIDLSFDGGPEYKTLRVASWLAVLGVALWLAKGRLRAA